jgi:hypothetical protein
LTVPFHVVALPGGQHDGAHDRRAYGHVHHRTFAPSTPRPRPRRNSETVTRVGWGGVPGMGRWRGERGDVWCAHTELWAEDLGEDALVLAVDVDGVVDGHRILQRDRVSGQAQYNAPQWWPVAGRRYECRVIALCVCVCVLCVVCVSSSSCGAYHGVVGALDGHRGSHHACSPTASQPAQQRARVEGAPILLVRHSSEIGSDRMKGGEGGGVAQGAWAHHRRGCGIGGSPGARGGRCPRSSPCTAPPARDRTGESPG